METEVYLFCSTCGATKWVKVVEATATCGSCKTIYPAESLSKTVPLNVQGFRIV